MSNQTHEASAQAGQHGFALLVVLWVLTAAIMLVASFNAAVHAGVASATSEVGQLKAEAVLDAGLEIAAAHLLDERDDHRWRPDGKRRAIPFGGVDLTISITDPNGLIDLNKSDEKVLQAFLQKFTGSQQSATRYTDLIIAARKSAADSKDDDSTLQMSSPEPDLSAQKSAGLPFIDISQLRRVAGMPVDLFNNIAPFITVYSRDGQINPQTAPREVLDADPDLDKAAAQNIKSAVSAAGVRDDPANAALDGPAYTVSVASRGPNDEYRTGRTFVIAMGLDPKAPYRLLAKRPTLTWPADASR